MWVRSGDRWQMVFWEKRVPWSDHLGNAELNKHRFLSCSSFQRVRCVLCVFPTGTPREEFPKLDRRTTSECGWV